jgi:hypothetical protein
MHHSRAVDYPKSCRATRGYAAPLVDTTTWRSKLEHALPSEFRGKPGADQIIVDFIRRGGEDIVNSSAGQFLLSMFREDFGLQRGQVLRASLLKCAGKCVDEHDGNADLMQRPGHVRAPDGSPDDRRTRRVAQGQPKASP